MAKAAHHGTSAFPATPFNEASSAITNLLQTERQNLNWASQNLSDVELQALFVALSGPSKLLSLDLSGSELSRKSLNMLQMALRKNTSLTRLSLSGTHLRDSGLRMLAEGLQASEDSSLYHLDFSECDITASGLGSLVNAISGLKNLRSLKLVNNNLNRDAGIFLGQALVSKHDGLEILDVSSNDLGDCGVGAIAGSIAADSSNLSRVGISPGSSGLQFSLTSLDLSAVGLGDEGLIALCKSFDTLVNGDERGGAKTECPLRILKLSDNVIGDAGAQALAQILQQKDQFRLEELDLARNSIGQSGVEALASSIAYSNTLHSVDLAGSGLHAGALLAIARGLKHNNRVRRLNISPPAKLVTLLEAANVRAGIEDALAEMAQSLSTNSSLIELSMNGYWEAFEGTNAIRSLQTILDRNNNKAAQFPGSQTPSGHTSNNHAAPMSTPRSAHERVSGSPNPNRQSSTPGGTPISDTFEIRTSEYQRIRKDHADSLARISSEIRGLLPATIDSTPATNRAPPLQREGDVSSGTHSAAGDTANDTKEHVSNTPSALSVPMFSMEQVSQIAQDAAVKAVSEARRHWESDLGIMLDAVRGAAVAAAQDRVTTIAERIVTEVQRVDEVQYDTRQKEIAAVHEALDRITQRVDELERMSPDHTLRLGQLARSVDRLDRVMGDFSPSAALTQVMTLEVQQTQLNQDLKDLKEKFTISVRGSEAKNRSEVARLESICSSMKNTIDEFKQVVVKDQEATLSALEEIMQRDASANADLQMNSMPSGNLSENSYRQSQPSYHQSSQYSSSGRYGAQNSSDNMRGHPAQYH